MIADVNAENDWGSSQINITQIGTFYKTSYKYRLTPLTLVAKVVKAGVGVGKIRS